MKIFLPFILLVVFLNACRQPETLQVHLTGVIQNPTGEPVELVFFTDFTNNEREIITLVLDPENRFDVSFDIPGPISANLRNGRSSLQLFLNPGDKLHLEVDANDWINTLAVSGEDAVVNAFFVEYQRELGVNLGTPFFNNAAMSFSAEGFKNIIDSVVKVQLGFLTNHASSGALTEEFTTFFSAEVQYGAKNRLLSYSAIHQRLNQLEQPAVISPGFFDFLNDAALFHDNLLYSEAYANFLLNFLGYHHDLNPGRFLEVASLNEIYYILAGELIPGLSGEFARAISINREFNFGEIEKARTLLDDFLATATSDDMKARASRTWDAIQALMPGKPAPDFMLTDINGQQVSLSDFKGKVVYLKFWASWCGPCMRQVPPATELKKRLADQNDLVFLYVSIDTDHNAWRTTVEHHGISGTHMVTPGRERGAPALYQVKWIPTFYIIGRDGNIFDNRPPQPSDPNVDEVLLKALAQ